MGEAVKDLRKLKKLVAHQISSYDYFVTTGIRQAIADLDPVEIEHDNKTMTIWISDINVTKPCKRIFSKPLYPSECRQASLSYAGQLFVTITTSIVDSNGPISKHQYSRQLGYIPIMVGSRLCHLHGKSPKEMVQLKEDANEMGGYFIVNGLEKLIRLVVLQRRNYPMCLSREAYTKGGLDFSPHCINIRCVRPDQTSQSFTLHYLNNGDCVMRIAINKRSYYLPAALVFRALVETSDREIYECIVNGEFENTFLTDRVEVMLRENQRLNCLTQIQCLKFIGSHFRPILNLPSRYTDSALGEYFLRKLVAIHLDDPRAKFDLLVFMVRKLYTFVSGGTVTENSDSVSVHELLLGGHLLNMILKERLMEFLKLVVQLLNRGLTSKVTQDIFDEKYFLKVLQTIPDIGRRLIYFLSTGNVISKSGLDLRQQTGFCIVAERLNYFRFLAHFRSVHRGQFFTELRTTGVRKLLPDSWGFFCPVHTPDGAPCGLLNHLTRKCGVTEKNNSAEPQNVRLALLPIGLLPISSSKMENSVPIILDGMILGEISEIQIAPLEIHLRKCKIEGSSGIPPDLEIVIIRPGGNQFPAIYLFSGPARLIRPVINLTLGKREYIGTFEQQYLTIAVRNSEIRKNTTHYEKSPMNMLSLAASMIPFCNSNQSPRNMYQCQMLKQTMGVPVHNFPFRMDNKLFRIQTPQTPLARNESHDKYWLDEYLTGTNAIVAVLSYTGFDMEDAMIINKSSYDRGFGHGCVYKTEMIDLALEFDQKKDRACFGNLKDSGDRYEDKLDEDGLPGVGQLLKYGDPYYCYWDNLEKQFVVKNYTNHEIAYVDGVVAVGYGDQTNQKGDLNLFQKVMIRLRLDRKPTRGDKFSSRHGQKGTLAQLWPQADMAFTESGMCPDVIINPNAFPSRMTVAMLIESMAAKSGALHGFCVDSTPFKFDEKNTAVDYFGKQLVKAGYNYYGNEPMYSGITGEEFKADIFFGVVYYQRLRHMVKDKFQARTTGPVNALTQQPVKGRKRGGGIRFGEMERDALLAHGAAFLLRDRLMLCSDAHNAWVCGGCGSLLTSTTPALNPSSGAFCHYCAQYQTKSRLVGVQIPFVTRYLTAELASMNIRTSFELKGSGAQ